jgi:hypothetical protein
LSPRVRRVLLPKTRHGAGVGIDTAGEQGCRIPKELHIGVDNVSPID